MESLKEMIDRIVADGVMTTAEHEEFMNRVHADGKIDSEESEQISRIFKLINDGKLRVINDERSQED